jgi:hypothetical protein
MDFLNPKHPVWRRLRWAWFVLALIGILMTPSAIMGAIEVYKTDHKTAWVLPFAFLLRFAQIGFFLWLWWKYRPAPQTDSNEPKTGAP